MSCPQHCKPLPPPHSPTIASPSRPSASDRGREAGDQERVKERDRDWSGLFDAEDAMKARALTGYSLDSGKNLQVRCKEEGYRSTEIYLLLEIKIYCMIMLSRVYQLIGLVGIARRAR